MSAFAQLRTERLIDRIATNNCVTLDGFRFQTKLGLAALTQQVRGRDRSAVEPWRGLITKNSVRAADLARTPLFVAQENADPIVAPAVTRAFVERLCRRPAARVRFLALQDGDHVNAGKRAAPDAVSWLADRFAGVRAPSDCGRL